MKAESPETLFHIRSNLLCLVCRHVVLLQYLAEMQLFEQWRAQASGGTGAKWRYEGTILGGGGGDGGCCPPSARGIMIHDCLSITAKLISLL